MRSPDGTYNPSEFDRSDWPRLARILNGENQGLRGTYLVRTDEKSWQDEVKKTLEELEREKAKQDTAAGLRGKEASGDLVSDDEAATMEDCSVLSGQLAGVFALDGDAAASLALDLFEGTPLLGGLASALKFLGLTVQILSRVVNQVLLSTLEASSVSVIEHEALIGAYALGKGELKRLTAALAEALFNVGTAALGVNAVTKISTTAVKLAVTCYLLIQDGIRVHKLNLWLQAGEPSAEVWKKRLRANPEIAVYLPFLGGSAVCAAHHGDGFHTPGEWAPILLAGALTERLRDARGNPKSAKSQETTVGMLFRSYIDDTLVTDAGTFVVTAREPHKGRSVLYGFVPQE